MQGRGGQHVNRPTPSPSKHVRERLLGAGVEAKLRGPSSMGVQSHKIAPVQFRYLYFETDFRARGRHL